MKKTLFSTFYLLLCCAATPLVAQNLDAMSIETLDSLYKDLNDKGRYTDALPYIQKAVAKAAVKYGKEDSLYAKKLTSFGVTYFYLKDYDNALLHGKQAVDIFERSNYTANNSYIKAVMNLAIFTENKLDYQEALALYNKCEKVFERIPNGAKNPLYAGLLTNLGVISNKMGNSSAAEKYYLKAMKLYEEISQENSPNYSNTLANLAAVYRSIGKISEAEQLLKKAIDIAARTQSKEHTDYFLRKYSLGVFYQQVGKYEASEKLLKEAAEGIKKALGEAHNLYSGMLQTLGTLYANWGKYEDAEIVYLEAKGLIEKHKGKESNDYANIASNLAALYWRYERYQEAEPLYLNAKAIYEKDPFHKNDNRYMGLLQNLGLLYKSVKRYDAAKELYLKANMRVQDSPINFFQAKNNLAVLYIETKEYDQAEAVLKEVLEERKKLLGAEHPHYAESLSSLSELLIKKQQYEQAVQTQLQALEIVKKSFQPQGLEYVREYANVAEAYKHKGDTASAIAYAYQSIALNAGKDSLPSTKIDEQWLSTLLSYEYAHHTELNRALKILDYLFAHDVAKKNIIERFALAVLQKTHTRFTAEEDKLRSLSNSVFWANKTVESAFELGQSDSKALATVFEAAEMNKAILLSYSIQTDKAYRFGGLPDSLYLMEQYYEAQMEQLKSELLQKQTEAARSKSYNQLSEMSLKMKAFQKDITQKYPKYMAIKNSTNIVAVAQLQAALDDKTTVVEYAITDSAVYLIGIDKTNFNVKKMPVTKAALADKVRDLRKALSDYVFIAQSPEDAYTLYTSTAHWFYVNLLAPILTKKQGQLLIIPDGELGHLPFEVFLQSPAPQDRNDYAGLPYLINDFVVYYNYSATLFQDNKQCELKV